MSPLTDHVGRSVDRLLIELWSGRLYVAAFSTLHLGSEPMEWTRFKDAVDGFLAEGPLTMGLLAERAELGGVIPSEFAEDDEDATDAIEGLIADSDDYWTKLDDAGNEVIYLASGFTDTGMTFTHHVSADELQDGKVNLSPDLSVLDWSCLDGLLLDDGRGSVVVDYSVSRAAQLAGPQGWLDGIEPGDLVAFTRNDGRVSLAVVHPDQLGEGTHELDALLIAAKRWVRDGEGEEEVPFVMDALAADASLFRNPVPPVGELLVAAGLQRRGHEWGWAAQEWKTRQETFS